MDTSNFTSLREVLNTNMDEVDLSNVFYGASKYMALLHKNGLYVTNFNPDHIKTNNNSVVFERVDRMTNRIIGDEVRSNIEAFTSLMVGCYINYTDSLLPMANLKRYYKVINYAFPAEALEYFNESINNGKICYYHEYIDNLRNIKEGTSNALSSSIVKVKSTAVGKLFSENDTSSRQAAFANVLIVSAIVCLIALVAVLTYVILK